MSFGFGVDLGGTTTKIACFDGAGTLLDMWEIPTVTQNSGKQILPDIANSVLAYIREKQLSRDVLLGIGLGVPGEVLPDGRVNKCVNLGWDVFPMVSELEALTGLPVKAGNDATLAALGECWKGSGSEFENLVFITLGTGVGGGIVLGGNVLFGSHGAGGEIGHMVLNPQETEACNCGKKGCAEQYCSATGIVRLAKKHLADNQMVCGYLNVLIFQN